MSSWYENLRWTCHICGDERPDALIGVLTKPFYVEVGEEYVEAQENVRYCVDRPGCVEGAKTFTHFSKRCANVACRHPANVHNQSASVTHLYADSDDACSLCPCWHFKEQDENKTQNPQVRRYRWNRVRNFASRVWDSLH